jgi:hypothetical protein
MPHVRHSQCYELTLLSGVDTAEFEKFLTEEIFPHFEILRRNVRGTIHRLLKVDQSDGAPSYLWLVFALLVGNTPETAGSGPTVLAWDGAIDWLDAVSQKLTPFATVTSFTEVAATADEWE